jgi:hypothetical protein
VLPLRFAPFLGGGAAIGLSLSATTSAMMEAMRMFASAGRLFLVAFFMPGTYHASSEGKQCFFKVPHYLFLVVFASVPVTLFASGP